LHSFTVGQASRLGPNAWERLGDDLRRMGHDHDPVAPSFSPSDPASVTVNGIAGGQTLVRVGAPDEIGLLYAACRWFVEQGLSIEPLHAITEDGIARDVFLVRGRCDARALTLGSERSALRA
jgi:hypothetical protein